MTESQRDLVIVGGGPAGVSAALECTDIKLDVVLLEAWAALGGQLPEITHPVRNVASGRYSDGTALQASLQDAAGALGERARLEHPVTAAALAEGWVEARRRTVFGQGRPHRQRQHPRTAGGGAGGGVRRGRHLRGRKRPGPLQRKDRGRHRGRRQRQP